MFSETNGGKRLISLLAVLLCFLTIGAMDALAQDVDIQDIYLPGNAHINGSSNGSPDGNQGEAGQGVVLEVKPGQFLQKPLNVEENNLGIRIITDSGRMFVNEVGPYTDQHNQNKTTQVEATTPSGGSTAQISHNADEAFLSGSHYLLSMDLKDVISDRLNLKLRADSEGNAVVAKISVGIINKIHYVDGTSDDAGLKMGGSYFYIAESGEIDLNYLIGFAFNQSMATNFVTITLTGVDELGNQVQIKANILKETDHGADFMPGANPDRIRIEVRSDVPEVVR